MTEYTALKFENIKISIIVYFSIIIIMLLFFLVVSATIDGVDKFIETITLNKTLKTFGICLLLLVILTVLSTIGTHYQNKRFLKIFYNNPHIKKLGSSIVLTKEGIEGFYKNINFRIRLNDNFLQFFIPVIISEEESFDKNKINPVWFKKEVLKDVVDADFSMILNELIADIHKNNYIIYNETDKNKKELKHLKPLIFN